MKIIAIMNRLLIPAGSRENVKKVLRDINACLARGKEYNGTSRRKRDFSIEENSQQANLRYHAMETGMSIPLTTFLLNTWRLDQNPPIPAASLSQIERFCKRSEIIDKSKRRLKKSRKDDKNSLWAIARLAEAIQFRQQKTSSRKY